MAKRKLTPKQHLFTVHYLDTLNGTEAARRAGYKGSDATLRSIASQNLTKLNIQEAIAEGMKKLAMPRDEVLVRLTKMARGEMSTKEASTPQGHQKVYDAKAALELLGKHHGLFTEKMILQWQEEAERAGIPASVLFERMVAEIMMELQKQDVD